MKSNRWKHSKSGKEYSITGTARHSETLEQMVVYQAEYGDRAVWVRPIKMWDELVDVNGLMVARFVRIE